MKVACDWFFFLLWVVLGVLLGWCIVRDFMDHNPLLVFLGTLLMFVWLSPGVREAFCRAIRDD